MANTTESITASTMDMMKIKLIKPQAVAVAIAMMAGLLSGCGAASRTGDSSDGNVGAEINATASTADEKTDTAAEAQRDTATGFEPIPENAQVVAANEGDVVAEVDVTEVEEEDTGEAEASEATSTVSQTVTDAGLPDTWEALTEAYPGMIGWLALPDTQLAAPVVSGTAGDAKDVVALNANNSTDGSDPVTEIIGGADDSLSVLYPLMDFTDDRFFEKPHTIYYYTEDTVYSYEVFASYPEPHRDLIADANFYDFNEYADYIGGVFDQRSIGANIKYDMLQNVIDTWQILTLRGTSSSGEDYVVQGVLTGSSAY